MIDHRLIRDRLIRGMSRLLESRRQDRMKEINLKVSSPEKRKKCSPARAHRSSRMDRGRRLRASDQELLMSDR